MRVKREKREAEQAITAVIEQLEDAKRRLDRKQLWSAYRDTTAARDALYFIVRDLAYRSPKAAMHWGCAIRLPDGSIGTLVLSGDGFVERKISQ